MPEIRTETKKTAIINSGGVRGGSGGSVDPPKILKPIEKKLNFKYSDPPRSKAWLSDPPM